MRTLKWLTPVSVLVIALLVSCTDNDPMTMMGDTAEISFAKSVSTDNVIAQDLAQTEQAGVTNGPRNGIFALGWRQFVGPNIMEDGMIGKAFVVVRNDPSATVRPLGMDIGTVSLSYGSRSSELHKLTNRAGAVVYSTFPRGLKDPATLPINIPFIPNGVYQFAVSGSDAFAAGTFSITAPSALLNITGLANRDTVSPLNDLTITWNGGAATDSVLIRVVPHLRPKQFGGRGPGPHSGRMEGPGPMGNGEPKDFGPEFRKGIAVKAPNTGTYTIPAAAIQNLLSGTEATALMAGVAQFVKQDVVHDGKSLTLLLRNGDRVVLNVR